MHNTIDVVVGVISAINPVFGLIYGAIDLGSELFTQKSISEHIQDLVE